HSSRRIPHGRRGVREARGKTGGEGFRGGGGQRERPCLLSGLEPAVCHEAGRREVAGKGGCAPGKFGAAAGGGGGGGRPLRGRRARRGERGARSFRVGSPNEAATRAHATMVTCQVSGSVQRAAATPARSGRKQR